MPRDTRLGVGGRLLGGGDAEEQNPSPLDNTLLNTPAFPEIEHIRRTGRGFTAPTSSIRLAFPHHAQTQTAARFRPIPPPAPAGFPHTQQYPAAGFRNANANPTADPYPGLRRHDFDYYPLAAAGYIHAPGTAPHPSIPGAWRIPAHGGGHVRAYPSRPLLPDDSHTVPPPGRAYEPITSQQWDVVGAQAWPWEMEETYRSAARLNGGGGGGATMAAGDTARREASGANTAVAGQHHEEGWGVGEDSDATISESSEEVPASPDYAPASPAPRPHAQLRPRGGQRQYCMQPPDLSPLPVMPGSQSDASLYRPSSSDPSSSTNSPSPSPPSKKPTKRGRAAAERSERTRTKAGKAARRGRCGGGTKARGSNRGRSRSSSSPRTDDSRAADSGRSWSPGSGGCAQAGQRQASGTARRYATRSGRMNGSRA